MEILLVKVVRLHSSRAVASVTIGQRLESKHWYFCEHILAGNWKHKAVNGPILIKQPFP